MTDTQPDDALARQGARNSWILMAAQALNGSGPVFGITLGGLAGAYLLGEDKSLATLPVSIMGAGGAAGALPAALLMQRIGRRLGLMGGNALAIIGGLVAAAALFADSFWLFAFAMLLVGFATAFVQQYRFAAAQAVTPNMRGIAISRVMIGGIVTALIAPQIIIVTRDLFDPPPFAGAFIALAGVTLVGMIVLGMLKFPPRAAAAAPNKTAAEAARALSVIARQPRFIVALLCAASSFALMAFVMTAAPLAMVTNDHSEANAVLGIQWHVIAMFGPSLFTGRLIAWLGKETIVAGGLAMLIASALVGIAGIELFHFWGMLILLGVGWNFAFIGATAMLTDTYRDSERGRVEGFNDFVVFGTVAVASFFSGRILSTSGWDTINYIVMPIVAIVLFSLFVLMVQGRRRPA
jgi:predicted MFS family arabinose efflux permease